MVEAGQDERHDERHHEAERLEVDGLHVLGSLSPSRAGDFMHCPLLFRFRTIDRLPEPPSPLAMRGTVVHKVLERLFDLAPTDRTLQRARDLLVPSWQSVRELEPEAAELFDDEALFDGEGPLGAQAAAWLESCAESLEEYFRLEDPTHLEPAERESYVEALLDSKLLLRGYVDRLDVTAEGDVRVVDYKTGKAPPVDYEARALFQMRFYALVLWRARGVIPRVLQLIYLGSGEVLRHSPDEADLLATERKILALWEAIEFARSTQDWRPNPGVRCGWCAHQAICPAWGGTPPPLPDPSTETPAPSMSPEPSIEAPAPSVAPEPSMSG